MRPIVFIYGVLVYNQRNATLLERSISIPAGDENIIEGLAMRGVETGKEGLYNAFTGVPWFSDSTKCECTLAEPTFVGSFPLPSRAMKMNRK
jgi:hypothetical protein